MNKWRALAISLAASAALLLAASAGAKDANRYKRCIDGCNQAKMALLKGCEKAQGQAKEKCRTLGTKKLEEECYSRCKKREKGGK